MINIVDLSNQSTDVLPDLINGYYYIYYEATTGKPSFDITPPPYIPLLNIKVFLEFAP